MMRYVFQQVQNITQRNVLHSSSPSTFETLSSSSFAPTINTTISSINRDRNVRQLSNWSRIQKQIGFIPFATLSLSSSIFFSSSSFSPCTAVTASAGIRFYRIEKEVGDVAATATTEGAKQAFGPRVWWDEKEIYEWCEDYKKQLEIMGTYKPCKVSINQCNEMPS